LRLEFRDIIGSPSGVHHLDISGLSMPDLDQARVDTHGARSYPGYLRFLGVYAFDFVQNSMPVWWKPNSEAPSLSAQVIVRDPRLFIAPRINEVLEMIRDGVVEFVLIGELIRLSC